MDTFGETQASRVAVKLAGSPPKSTDFWRAEVGLLLLVTGPQVAETPSTDVGGTGLPGPLNCLRGAHQEGGTLFLPRFGADGASLSDISPGVLTGTGPDSPSEEP